MGPWYLGGGLISVVFGGGANFNGWGAKTHETESRSLHVKSVMHDINILLVLYLRCGHTSIGPELVIPLRLRQNMERYRRLQLISFKPLIYALSPSTLNNK